MSFTTLTYLLFFGVVFTLYWLIQRRTAQNFLLLIAGYCFYAWWDYRFCALMAMSSVVDYSMSRLMDRCGETRSRKAVLCVSIAFNFGLLGFFKYYNFFIENFSTAMSGLGVPVEMRTLYIILPVGISFYTFQTMGYLIDVYRREIKPVRNLLEYMAYVSFFPQLVAGPIERAGHLLRQFGKPRHFDYDLAADGGRQALWGFVKKTLIADSLGTHLVNPVYGDIHAYSGPTLALATVAFAFQIYFDFSAYSDIAIGSAKLLGFDLIRNFAYPYFSQSVGEFWRRWHISLSSWFRDYLYISLGGSRVGTIRKAWNVTVTFLVSGLWHGASWNYIIWGGLNGAGTLPSALAPRSPHAKAKPTDTPGGESLIPSAKTIARIASTFFLICITWVFFRAQTLHEAIYIFKRITLDVMNSAGYQQAYALAFRTQHNALYVAFLFAAVTLEWIMRRHPHPIQVARWPRSARWAFYTMVFWFTICAGAMGNSEFIYFQF